MSNITNSCVSMRIYEHRTAIIDPFLKYTDWPSMTAQVQKVTVVWENSGKIRLGSHAHTDGIFLDIKSVTMFDWPLEIAFILFSSYRHLLIHYWTLKNDRFPRKSVKNWPAENGQSFVYRKGIGVHFCNRLYSPRIFAREIDVEMAIFVA